MSSQNTIEASNMAAELGGLVLGGITGYLQKQTQQKAQNQAELLKTADSLRDSGNVTGLQALFQDKKTTKAMFGNNDPDMMMTAYMNTAKAAQASAQAKAQFVQQFGNAVVGNQAGTAMGGLAAVGGIDPQTAVTTEAQMGEKQAELANQKTIATERNKTTIEAANIHGQATKAAAQVRATAEVGAARLREQGADRRQGNVDRNYNTKLNTFFNTITTKASNALRSGFKDAQAASIKPGYDPTATAKEIFALSTDALAAVMAANPAIISGKEQFTPEGVTMSAQKWVNANKNSLYALDENGKPATIKQLESRYSNKKTGNPQLAKQLQRYISYLVSEAVASSASKIGSGPLFSGEPSGGPVESGQ